MVELDTIKASDAKTQYCDFTSYPQHIVVSVDFSPERHNRKKIYTQIYTLLYKSVALYAKT